MYDRIQSMAADVAPYLPPALGSLIGLYWSKNQTPMQKTIGFVAGFGLGMYFGPAASEVLNLGPKATVAAGILIAVVGMDIVGGLLAAAQAFRHDPMAVLRRAVALWRGSNGEQH